MASLTSNQSQAALLDDPTAVLRSAWFHPVVTRFRRMFVLVSPAETSFGTVEEVPDYVAEVSRRHFKHLLSNTLYFNTHGRHFCFCFIRCRSIFNKTRLKLTLELKCREDGNLIVHMVDFNNTGNDKVVAETKLLVIKYNYIYCVSLFLCNVVILNLIVMIMSMHPAERTSLSRCEVKC